MSAGTLDWPNLPLFSGLSRNYIDLLARTATEQRFEPRELIFHEGDQADKFYLIVEGNVAVEIFVNERGRVTIQTLRRNEILGWSWLVEPYQWHFDAQAKVSTQAIEFDAELIRNSFERHPEFGYTMMTRFAAIIVRRLEEARLQLVDIHNYVCG